MLGNSVRRFFTWSVLLGLLVGLMPPAAWALTYSSTAAPTWIPNGQVWAITVTPTRVYLGGDFSSLKNPVTGASVTRNHLAAIDRATGNPTSWAPNVIDNPAIPDPNGQRRNPAIAAILVNGNTVYVGGDFTAIGATDRNFAAAISASTGAVTSWNPLVEGGLVWDFSLDGSDLYMVGQFGKVGGNDSTGAARVDASTAAHEPGWDVQMVGQAQAIAKSGNTIYLGGTFTELKGQARNYLASVNDNNGDPTGWTPPTQCPDIATICRVRDLAVDGSHVYAAIGGEPGGRAGAWLASGANDEPEWKHEADGEVQAVTVYDGVVYFGGHFKERITELTPAGDPGTRSPRNQFYAADPDTGVVLPYTIPAVEPARPGIRVIQADATAIRIGGTTPILNKPYKNFLTFAAPGVTIPGPVATTTRLVVKTKGCKTCKVRVYEDRGSDTPWKSKWKKAKKSKTVFSVPTHKTVGLTVQIKAPWERRMKKTTEVVMRYSGRNAGQKIGPIKAAKYKKATSCWAGTVADSAKLVVATKRVALGGKIGTRAWTKTTKIYLSPMRKSKKGVLMVKKVTACS